MMTELCDYCHTDEADDTVFDVTSGDNRPVCQGCLDHLEGETTVDEILEKEVREQLLEQGLDSDTVEIQLADMRDNGMFEVPHG